MSFTKLLNQRAKELKKKYPKMTYAESKDEALCELLKEYEELKEKSKCV